MVTNCLAVMLSPATAPTVDPRLLAPRPLARCHAAAPSPLRRVRRTSRLLLVLCIAVASMLTAATTATAALPATFDGLSPGTSVSTQFSADGIEFQDPAGVPGRPVVKDVGTKAQSGTKVAVSTCDGCEFDTHEILIRFPTLASTASFYLGIDSNSSTTQNVELQTLGASLTPVAPTRDIQIDSSDFKQQVIVDPPGTDGVIAYLRLRIQNGWSLGIDTINATFPAAVTPDFSVIPRSEALLVRAGGSSTVQVDVPRFNGSSGTINLAATGLPFGVSASFLPGAITGTGAGPTTLTLTANGEVFPGSEDATITGTPAAGSAGASARSAPLQVIVEQAFDVTGPERLAATPCVAATANVFVTRARSGFADGISLTAEAPEGWAAELSETSLSGAGGVSGHALTLTLRSTRPDPPAGGNVVVRASSPGLRDSTHTIPIDRQFGRIDAFTPTAGSPPRQLRGGTTVRIFGSGFCEGASVRFGNADAASPAVVDPSGTFLTTTVPRYATTGPLTVMMPGRGIISAAPFVAQGPRRTDGFRFNNFDHPGVDLDVLTELYGAEQTQISFDPCNPAPGLIPPICPIPTGIPNPLAGLYIGISNAALSGAGSCFGIAATAEHLSSGVVPRSAFDPAGAASTWELRGTSGPAPSLARRIRTWHSAQLSSSYLGYWIDTAALNVTNSGRGSRSTVLAELRAGRRPIIALRNGGSGHVVVAHHLRDTPDGGYLVDVYDPNLEFLAGEEDGTGHVAREDGSVITVSPSGRWSFPGAFDTTWSGPSDHMVVAAMSVMGERPRMPTDPSGFVTLLVPFAEGGAAVKQVTDGDGKQLLGADGDLNPDVATRAKGTITPTLSGTSSRTLYAISGRSAGIALGGTRGGSTGASILAPGFAAEVSGLQTRAGSADGIKVDGKAGKLKLGAARGGTLQASLARQVSSTDQVGAQLRIAGGDRGNHDVQLAAGPGGLRYENGGRGPAAMRATLTWTGKRGTPGEATLPAVTVPAGGSAQAAPSSWGKLASAPVRLLVKNRSGRVVRRLQVRPRGANRVSRVRVSTRIRKGVREARVRVSFRGVPKRATVQVGVHLRKGKQLAFSQMLAVPSNRARRTRTFTIALGQLPKGRFTAYGTAVVSDGGKVHSRRHTTRLRVR